MIEREGDDARLRRASIKCISGQKCVQSPLGKRIQSHSTGREIWNRERCYGPVFRLVDSSWIHSNRAKRSRRRCRCRERNRRSVVCRSGTPKFRRHNRRRIGHVGQTKMSMSRLSWNFSCLLQFRALCGIVWCSLCRWPDASWFCMLGTWKWIIHARNGHKV